MDLNLGVTIVGEVTDHGVEMARQIIASAQRPRHTIVLKTPDGEYTLANGQAVMALQAELARVRAENDQLRAELAVYVDDDHGFKRLEANEPPGPEKLLLEYGEQN